MSLADIMAKKRAAALGSVSVDPAKEDTDQTVAAIVNKESFIAALVIPAPIINTEVAVTQVPKKLTFQELMAAKKLTGSILSPVVAAGNADSPTVVSSITESELKVTGDLPNVQGISIPALGSVAPTASIPVKADTTIPTVQPVSLQPSVPSITNDTDAEQAYADISQKIEALLSLSDTPLENAMKDLKKALLTNPNAVALMEDTDFGKMVIALRNLTKEAAVENLKEKVAGKKSKNKLSLDPDAVALAFEEI